MDEVRISFSVQASTVLWSAPGTRSSFFMSQLSADDEPMSKVAIHLA